MFAPCINNIKALLIAPTCFGSRRNHHQGAITCLAKTTVKFFIVVPCILITLKFLSPTNAPLYYTYKMLKYTARPSPDRSYMLRSTCLGPPGPSSGSPRRTLPKSFLYRVPHTCTTGWYAAMTWTTSLKTST